MMMARKSKGPGERHKKIILFLAEHQEKNQYPPTIREIGEATNITSTSVVNYYLDQLKEMGYIERDTGVSRGIRLTAKANEIVPGLFDSLLENAAKAVSSVKEAVEEVFSIPVLGRIFASEPTPVPDSGFSYYDTESSVSIARGLLPSKTDDLFALEVQGDSMIDALINDGDIVIMKRAENKDVQNGDMVAVWLPARDETTLKYFYKETNGYRLQPANPTMQPIMLKKDEIVEVRGKVVMVVRQLHQ